MSHLHCILIYLRLHAFYSSISTDIDNYRPISSQQKQNIISNKIFENLTYHRIQSHVSKHNMLSDNQFSFRKSRSCTLATFKLVSDLLCTVMVF